MAMKIGCLVCVYLPMHHRRMKAEVGRGTLDTDVVCERSLSGLCAHFAIGTGSESQPGGRTGTPKQVFHTEFAR